jgi:hypothetical protein
MQLKQKGTPVFRLLHLGHGCGKPDADLEFNPHRSERMLPTHTDMQQAPGAGT